MKNILLISLFVFLGACAKSGNGNDTNVATVPNPTINANNNNANGIARGPYGYNYAEQNCSTGPQRYPTLAHYCEGLRNDIMNNRCAIQARYQDFRQYCGGYRWQR